MAGPGQDHTFAREEVFPSWFANRLQDLLSAGKLDLVLSRKNATTIQVVPDAILGIAAVNIKGRWRFNTAAVERAVSGAKATYGIWAVAEDNSINNTPSPFTDHTVYTFDLRVSAAEPSVGAGTAINQKIGEVDWSGTEIEAIRQNRGAVTGAQIADGALEVGTDIEWKRAPGGGLIPVLKSPTNAAYKQLMVGKGGINVAVGQYILFEGGATPALNALGASGVSKTESSNPFSYVHQPAAQLIAGKTMKMRLAMSLWTPATGSGTGRVFGRLIALEVDASGKWATKEILGTELGPITGIPAHSLFYGNSADFNAPTTPGQMLLGFGIKLETEAVPAGTGVSMELQYRHV